MRRTRHSAEQIVNKLREADAMLLTCPHVLYQSL